MGVANIFFVVVCVGIIRISLYKQWVSLFDYLWITNGSGIILCENITAGGYVKQILQIP